LGAISFDLLIKNGLVVDPANHRQGGFDVALAGGRVARVEQDISPDMAKEVFDATGKYVFPGLVDSHMHLTTLKGTSGFTMLAKAGVTCALECTGFIDDVIKGMAAGGSGISVAVLHRLDPGVSISSQAAGKKELAEYLERTLASGGFGLKLLGGHFPLTPETTTAAIEVCNQAGAYVAFHCGSTKNGSNLNGLLDTLEFAGQNRLHVCHINAYCRGLTHGSPVTESMIALKELSLRPHLVSESHMGPYNACWANLENDAPRSQVTCTCLKAGGYPVSKEGLRSAARAGYMRVQKSDAAGVGYLDPEAGLAFMEEREFNVQVSFPVNKRSTAFLMATEKNEKGGFIVHALSTDGGCIPRNFILSHGLSLVRFDALSLGEFVAKSSWVPARMLGLMGKGHLGVGADGDVVVADPDTHQALLTVAGGRIIMKDGVVTGTGGVIVTTQKGEKALAAQKVPVVTADLANSLFYTA